MVKRVLSLLILTISGVSASQATPSIAERARGMVRMEGFVDLYWEAATGHLFLEIDPAGKELLYQVSLASGLGSNLIGLDRGQLGGTHVVRTERIGPRLLLGSSVPSLRRPLRRI